jgi:hypothetical protein
MNEVIKELLQAKGKVFKVQHSHNHAQHDHWLIRWGFLVPLNNDGAWV